MHCPSPLVLKGNPLYRCLAETSLARKFPLAYKTRFVALNQTQRQVDEAQLYRSVWKVRGATSHVKRQQGRTVWSRWCSNLQELIGYRSRSLGTTDQAGTAVTCLWRAGVIATSELRTALHREDTRWHRSRERWRSSPALRAELDVRSSNDSRSRNVEPPTYESDTRLGL